MNPQEVTSQKIKVMNKNKRRLYLYKDGEKPKIVLETEKAGLLNKGWLTTPAKFGSIAERFKIDRKDTSQKNMAYVQNVDDAISGTKDYLNGVLNLDLMLLKELKRFAKKHMKVNFKSKEKKVHILRTVKDYVHSTENN